MKSAPHRPKADRQRIEHDEPDNDRPPPEDETVDMEAARDRPKAHWLWVEDDEAGGDRRQLEDVRADAESGEEFWSNCDKDTSEGDLVLLYRRSPTAALVELLEITSDAGFVEVQMADDELGSSEFTVLASAGVANDPDIAARFQAFLTALDPKSEQADIEGLWHDFVRAVLEPLGFPPDTVVVDDSLDGTWVCSWVTRHTLARPLTFREMKADPFLSDKWPSLRSRFRTDALIPADVWTHLSAMLRARDPAFGQVIDSLGN